MFYDMGVMIVMVSGCNDLFVDGKKFFGNVMYLWNGKMFFYGILMLNVDLNVVL